AVLRADDVRAPAVAGEALGQAGGHRVGGVAPQVVLVAAGDVLLVDEALHRVFLGIVGRAQQEARQRQADVAGVLLLAKALPLGELRAFEVVLQVLDVGQPGELLQRSEEHTSELQSRENLVCRLLLEKKKGRREGPWYYTRRR